MQHPGSQEVVVSVVMGRSKACSVNMSLSGKYSSGGHAGYCDYPRRKSTLCTVDDHGCCILHACATMHVWMNLKVSRIRVNHGYFVRPHFNHVGLCPENHITYMD